MTKSFADTPMNIRIRVNNIVLFFFQYLHTAHIEELYQNSDFYLKKKIHLTNQIPIQCVKLFNKLTVATTPNRQFIKHSVYHHNHY